MTRHTNFNLYTALGSEHKVKFNQTSHDSKSSTMRPPRKLPMLTPNFKNSNNAFKTMGLQPNLSNPKQPHLSRNVADLNYVLEIA
jgi:hypothetical protein